MPDPRPENGVWVQLGGQEDIQQSTRMSFLHFVCLYWFILVFTWELGAVVCRSYVFNGVLYVVFPFAFENNDAGCENSYWCSQVHFCRAIESIVGKWGKNVRTLQKA